MPDVARIADRQTQQVPYILGHSETEMRRLMVQSAILRPITGVSLAGLRTTVLPVAKP